MLKTKVGYSELEDAYASGVETAKMANEVENPQVGLFFTSCVQDQEQLMEGAKSILGDVPIVGCTSSAALCTHDGYLNKETGYSGMMLFGGSAADNTVEGKWSILNDGEAFADGCVIAIFYTNGEMKNLYTGAYHETNNAGIITKINGSRTLVEIDHEPALKKYAEWTGKNVNSLLGNNLLTETICAPLGVKDPIGKVTAVRHPMFGNDDYSMNIGADLAENTAVILLKNSPEGILKANEETIEKVTDMMEGEIQSYFLVHCGGRRLGLALASIEDKIYPEVKKAIPDKEFLMVFTFGEYGEGDHSSNTVGGLSLSYTAFGE